VRTIIFLVAVLDFGTSSPHVGCSSRCGDLQIERVLANEADEKQAQSSDTVTLYTNSALLLGSLVTILFTVGALVSQIASRHATESLKLLRESKAVAGAWVGTCFAILLNLSLAAAQAEHIAFKVAGLLSCCMSLLLITAAIPTFFDYVDRNRIRVQLFIRVQVALSTAGNDVGTQHRSHAIEAFSALLRLGRLYIAERDPIYAQYLDFSSLIHKADLNLPFAKKLSRKMLVELSYTAQDCAARRESDPLHVLLREIRQCATALGKKGDHKFLRHFATSILQEPRLSILLGLKEPLLLQTFTQLAADIFTLGLPAIRPGRSLESDISQFVGKGYAAGAVCSALGASESSHLFVTTPARCQLDIVKCSALTLEQRRKAVFEYLSSVTRNIYASCMIDGARSVPALVDCWMLSIDAAMKAGWHLDVAEAIATGANQTRYIADLGGANNPAGIFGRAVLGAERRWRDENASRILTTPQIRGAYEAKVIGAYHNLLSLSAEKPEVVLAEYVSINLAPVISLLCDIGLDLELERLFSILFRSWSQLRHLKVFRAPPIESALRSLLAKGTDKTTRIGQCALKVTSQLAATHVGTLSSCLTVPATQARDFEESTLFILRLIQASAQTKNWDFATQLVTQLEAILAAYPDLSIIEGRATIVLMLSCAPYVYAEANESLITKGRIRHWIAVMPVRSRETLAVLMEDAHRSTNSDQPISVSNILELLGKKGAAT
jgi:hypothetical protein